MATENEVTFEAFRQQWLEDIRQQAPTWLLIELFHSTRIADRCIMH